ncbi:MAG: glycoside hydrolase family 3 N-terminal domain-containing protein, partial [Spirochaetales bacterium]
EQKVAQLFLVSVDGTDANLSATAYDIPPGGYMLFSRNTVDGAESIIALTGDTQVAYAEKNEIPPFFAIDHEGGEVNRLRNIATPLPAAQTTATYVSTDLASQLYAYSAKQIAALGIQVNLAPVVESAHSGNNDFLSLRSFGDAEKVEIYANIFIDAFTDNSVYCVLKHFPGNANDDPHITLPILSGEKEKIYSLYIEPFKNLLADNGLLMSHVIVPAFDDTNPACLSPVIIKDIVQDELHFSGLIFSDDMLMGALSENSPQTAMKSALEAGIHVLMISHPAYWNFMPELVNEAIENPDFALIIDNCVTKILHTKIDMGLFSIEEDDMGNPVLVGKDTSELYNPEEQLKDFLNAKEEGDAVYYESIDRAIHASSALR